MQTPSVGRIVHFRLSAEQAEQINRRRVFHAIPEAVEAKGGAQRHVGNSVAEGSVVPMIVTAVWPDEFTSGHLSHHAAIAAAPRDQPLYESTYGVNGQALLDGSDSLWVCSAPQHATLTGCWFWPPRS